MNLVPLFSNLARAYEIAMLGGHSIRLINSNEDGESILPEKEVDALYDFYRLKPETNADILVGLHELSAPAIIDCVTGKLRGETLVDLRQRVDRAESHLMLADFDDALPKDTYSYSLLGTAITRLKFTLSDVDTIIRVSATIAALDGKSKIHLENIAEAIQYRAFPYDVRFPKTQNNTL